MCHKLFRSKSRNCVELVMRVEQCTYSTVTGFHVEFVRSAKNTVLISFSRLNEDILYCFHAIKVENETVRILTFQTINKGVISFSIVIVQT